MAHCETFPQRHSRTLPGRLRRLGFECKCRVRAVESVLVPGQSEWSDYHIIWTLQPCPDGDYDLYVQGKLMAVRKEQEGWVVIE